MATTIEGALFFPSEMRDGAREWVWEIPLLSPDADGPPDGTEATLTARGDDLDECIVRMSDGLRALGFVGEAWMDSICWRYQYGVVTMHEDGTANCDINPGTILGIEREG
jgi:hypothetical protein